MDEIKLNFINRSNDANNNNIVIFQKNTAASADEPVVAWKVIQNCGRLDNHPFVYPSGFSVSAADAYLNFYPMLPAGNSQVFEMVRGDVEDAFQLATATASKPTEVEVENNLPTGAISAHCYKDRKLLGFKMGIAPGQKAVFEFKPTIFIGVVSQMEEGEIMDSAILSDINTELGLLGISSADIVMTGGGAGASSTPFTFTLENIVYV